MVKNPTEITTTSEQGFYS